MCIAILNNGKMLPKKKLQNCWNNNDDGAGILYIQDGKLQVEKFSNAVAVNSTQNFDKFFKRYTDIKSSASGFMPMLLHFRIATHGFSDDYLHPFLVSDDLGLVHNGVISGFGSKELSDTAEFTQLLGTMPGMTNCDMLDIAFIEDAIYTFIGASNKLIFLDATGEYRILTRKPANGLAIIGLATIATPKRCVTTALPLYTARVHTTGIGAILTRRT